MYVRKKSGPAALAVLLLFPIFPWAIVVAWLVLKCRLVVSPLLIPPPLHPSRRLKVRLGSLP